MIFHPSNIIEAYCGFSSGYCQWEVAGTGDFKFNRQSGDFMTGQGPSEDFEGASDGIFALADPALNANSDFISAKLVSPKFDRKIFASGCFQFWYSVKGVSTELLIIQIISKHFLILST